MFKRKKIVGEENRSQLQAVVFSDNQSSVSSLKKSQLDSYDELESYKRLRKRRVKIACYRMAIWLVVVLFIPIFIFLSVAIISPNKMHNLFGYTFYIVASESMKPEIDVNDCIIISRVSSEDSIKVGDDITFIRNRDGETVTHRVFAIEERDGQKYFITKGTHNPNVDEGYVTFDSIIGRRVATVGWVGQTIMFFRTWYGLMTFIAGFVLVLGLFYLSFRISDDIRAVGK